MHEIEHPFWRAPDRSWRADAINIRILGLRETRNGPSSMSACVACPGSSPVWCRTNNRSDQLFHPTKNSTSAQPRTRHSPKSIGSPRTSVTNQPTNSGVPIATGGQSRYETVSWLPCTMPSSRGRPPRVGGRSSRGPTTISCLGRWAPEPDSPRSANVPDHWRRRVRGDDPSHLRLGDGRWDLPTRGG
jgi:hypothetical protein